MEEITINDKIKEVLKGTSFEDYQYEDFNNADDLIESLQEQIDQDEIIYYSNAIKYLAENDASLHDCMAIAADLGYETKDLNSELLATLLQQQNFSAELGKLKDDLEACFDNER